MPKAILELEMPESCRKCPCSWRIRDNVIACEVTKHYCPEEGRRPDCPLKLVEGVNNVRLIDADALKSKIREQSWKQETKVSLMLDWIYMLIDEASTVSTVQNKALQQENEQLRAKLEDWKHEVKCHMDEVIAREKQIEQLRVRVARMRELLTKAYDEIERYKCLWKSSKPSGCDCPKPTALQDEIEQTLAEIDKAIGGKEDEKTD